MEATGLLWYPGWGLLGTLWDLITPLAALQGSEMLRPVTVSHSSARAVFVLLHPDVHHLTDLQDIFCLCGNWSYFPYLPSLQVQVWQCDSCFQGERGTAKPHNPISFSLKKRNVKWPLNYPRLAFALIHIWPAQFQYTHWRQWLHLFQEPRGQCLVPVCQPWGHTSDTHQLSAEFGHPEPWGCCTGLCRSWALKQLPSRRGAGWGAGREQEY